MAWIFNQAHEDLRRQKLAFIAAETQLRFMEGCHSSDGGLGAPSSGLETRRREARARNKALKAELGRERERHEGLCRRLSEVLREAAEKQAECECASQEMAHLTEVEEREAQEPIREVCGIGADVEQAERRAVVTLLEGNDAERRRRQRLEEEEVQQLKAQRMKYRAEIAEFERRETLERARVQQLEDLAVKGAELGLPRIEFDEGAGKVTLEGGNCPRPELRTVRIQMDSDTGRLLRAEPHPSLGLWAESTGSVEQDDLARLLTLVWDRINSCQERCVAFEGGA